MLHDSFTSLLSDTVLENVPDLYPKKLRTKIEKMHQWIYDDILNGVYKTGFAANQEAYQDAFKKLFKGLDKVDKIL